MNIFTAIIYLAGILGLLFIIAAKLNGYLAIVPESLFWGLYAVMVSLLMISYLLNKRDRPDTAKIEQE